MADVHYINVGRYERGDAKPSADVLNRLNNALGVSPGFLMNETLYAKAQNSLSERELLSKFKKTENMTEDRKRILKKILDSFVLKTDFSPKPAHS